MELKERNEGGEAQESVTISHMGMCPQQQEEATHLARFSGQYVGWRRACELI